jgi:hypothetical protein
VEEQARGLHAFDGWDLLVELEELHTRVARVEDECAAKAGKLSMLVVGIFNALDDLGMLPIWEMPQLPKMAREVLVVTGLILERLREEHAFGAGP